MFALGELMLPFIGAIVPRTTRQVRASTLVVQSALLDAGKSCKALAADGGWDAPSLSRQFSEHGLNFAGLFTAAQADHEFAVAWMKRLSDALNVSPSELGAADTLAARVARIESILAVRQSSVA